MENSLKKTNVVFLIAVVVIVIVNFVFYMIYDSSQVKHTSADLKEDRIHILIDAGHGGMDCGAVNKYGENESYINLKISNKLYSFLKSIGFDVSMTRYTDAGLYEEGKKNSIRSKKNEDLRNRLKIINDSNADIVISVHLNSFPQSKYYGAQTFYQKNDEEGKKCAIIIQENLRDILDKNNKRVPQIKRNVYIMDRATKTIVLVECGFLTNPTEATKLNSEVYQEKVAWAILSGILEYYH